MHYLTKLIGLSLLLCAVIGSPQVHAGKCDTGIINPVTDVSWQCIFPISIGGMVSVSPGDVPPDNDKLDSPACVCQTGSLAAIGINVSFWEPARYIDTVKDPYCFTAIGTELPNPSPGTLGGSLSRGEGRSSGFAQMHYYIFPVWGILNMFYDIPCLEKQPFDVAMISEVLPTWNNEVLAMIINPEALLFANPAAIMSCAADATAILNGKPRDELFWCQGSWPGAYPLAGSATATDYVEMNAALAGRSIYMMGRTGLLLDPGIDGCASYYTPIWKKSHYRLQLAKPVRDKSCRSIGESGMLWSHMKNPPTAGDNFGWVMFRKVKCCITDL